MKYMKQRLEEELLEQFVEEFDVPEQPKVTIVEPEWSSDGRSWVIEGNDRIVVLVQRGMG